MSSALELAKAALDVGVALRARTEADAQGTLVWWRQVARAVPDHVLPIGGGLRQHRHRWGESVVKLNQQRGGQPTNPDSGWGPLMLFAPELDASSGLIDPDGNLVSHVPDTETRLDIELRVRDPEASLRFFDAFGLPVTDRRVEVGTSGIRVELDSSASIDPAMRGPGYRYTTIQVHGVDTAFESALAAGAMPGEPPRTLGEVARIAFIREPGGNWIELSQRRSITGSLQPT